MQINQTNPIIENIRRALGRKAGDPAPERPAILPPRLASQVEAEIDQLLKEINALAGVASRASAEEVASLLQSLVEEQAVQKATLWPTPGLKELQIAEQLGALGVEIVSPYADKRVLAECDLGVTEVDFALPETGTIGLLSGHKKPRSVSLLPRVHLAILRPAALCADLHQVFSLAKNQHYLVFITGPSRTADIELTVTLGVHGPKAFYLWAFS